LIDRTCADSPKELDPTMALYAVAAVAPGSMNHSADVQTVPSASVPVITQEVVKLRFVKLADKVVEVSYIGVLPESSWKLCRVGAVPPLDHKANWPRTRYCVPAAGQGVAGSVYVVAKATALFVMASPPPEFPQVTPLMLSPCHAQIASIAGVCTEAFPRSAVVPPRIGLPRPS
jgi:hypothetical protein